MISFETTRGWFNYRVAGIAIIDGRVLLHRRDGDDFWTLPGGRPELLEDASDCLRRELREEIDLDVSVTRLVWIVENFFRYQDTPFHEVLLCFEMTSASLTPINALEFAGIEGSTPLTFWWCPLDDLETVNVQPSFLRHELRRLPASPLHIVQRS